MTFEVGKAREQGAGRPAGSLNKATAEIKMLARAHADDVIAGLVRLMNGKARNKEGHDIDAPAAVQLAAMQEILNRAYGKSVQPHDGDGEGGLINFDIRALTLPQLEMLLERIDELRAAPRLH